MSRLLMQRYTKSRRSFTLERLEPRQLLSVGSNNPWTSPASGSPQPASELALAGPLPALSILATASAGQSVITSTTPANGDQLSQTPDSLVVTFNQEVQSFIWADGSVLLDRVEADGTLTQVFDLNNLPVATFDATGSQATIPLDQPLTPGHYRIVLAGGSSASQNLDNGSWDSSIDQPLADFTVLQPGVTLKDATDLGTLGPQVLNTSGSLDLSNGHNDVALYQFTIGPGHFWQLGVELDASRMGSSLLGALSLFDSAGKVLATRNSGTGQPSASGDPFLFAGLKPGVYYIGVSGMWNLPGGPGGYNPIDGTVGSAGQPQAGGAFDLKLVADRADAPTRETGFTLNWQDPLSTVPTGFSLAFSGPLDLSTLLDWDGNVNGVDVVDAAGKTWPISGVYVQNNQQMSFVFGQALPPGRYTLEIPASGGITDLAGRSPLGSGPGGNILATWKVEPSKSVAQPNNLGVIWPAGADGASGTTTLSPGQTVVYRVVIPAAGVYSLQTTLQGGALQVQRLGGDGLVVLDQNTEVPLMSYDMKLTNGVYLFSMTAAGTQPATVQWVFKPKTVKSDSLADNGVGQSTALALRLTSDSNSYLAPNAPPDLSMSTVSPGNVTPVVLPTGPTATIPTPTTSTSPSVPAGLPAPSAAAVSSNGLSPIPASLLVTVNSGLLGGPSAASEALGVVGPAVPGGAVALTDSSSGLMRGILYMSRGTVEDQISIRPDDAPGLTEPAMADRGSTNSTFAGAAASLEAAERSSQADAAALGQADRLAGIAAMVGRLFSLGSGADDGLVPHDSQSAPQVILAEAASAQPDPSNGEPTNTGADRIERAEIGIPIALLMISAAAYRLRHLTSHWWRRSHGRKDPYTRPRSSGLGPGPRSFRKKTGATSGKRPSLKC